MANSQQCETCSIICPSLAAARENSTASIVVKPAVLAGNLTFRCHDHSEGASQAGPHLGAPHHHLKTARREGKGGVVAVTERRKRLGAAQHSFAHWSTGTVPFGVSLIGVPHVAVSEG